VLKSLVIVCGRGCFKSRAGLHSKLQTLCSPERGPANAAYHRFMLVQSPHGPWVKAIVVSFSLSRKEQGKASNICERNRSFLRKMQIIYLFGFQYLTWIIPKLCSVHAKHIRSSFFIRYNHQT
jgi:hypothetical protein